MAGRCSQIGGSGLAIDLRSYTAARVALGRAGNGLPTAELLRFQLDHAQARDAVYAKLDLGSLGFPHLILRSAAADRHEYLRNPGAGRRLAPGQTLERTEPDLVLVVADGLSAVAVQRHAAHVISELPAAPCYLVQQGRVAVGDEIGERLGAKLVLVLIGERPGLTSPDSLGAYLTYDPRLGRTDAERNCVSNIRPEGLSYTEATHKLRYLISESLRRKVSGIALKEAAPRLITGS